MVRSRATAFGLVALVGAGLCRADDALSPEAGTYYVEGTNPACLNTGAGTGTAAVPYCTISAAAAARGGPGTTILVKPGVYREQVSVPFSGLPGSRFEIQALGSPVTIDGADDFSGVAHWTQISGSLYRASNVTSDPVQVFVDGVRMSKAAAGPPPASLPTNTFQWANDLSNTLYLNVGGDNPGLHATFIGRRSNGFRLSGRAYVTIAGFNVMRTEDYGIYLLGGANNDTIVRNTVTYAGNSGIVMNGGTIHLIDSNIAAYNNNHGISLQNAVTDSTVRNNECYQNARIGGIAANGIKLDGASRILVEANRAHDNQDSGLQFNHTDSNFSRQNRSWNNGDHGYDHLDAHLTSHIGDVAYGNYHDGVSIEGGNTDISLTDCISVFNGVVTNRYNLWVDSASTAGFTSDYNIFWNPVLQPPIKYVSTAYATIAEFTAATGKDPHSIQGNPLFVNPSAGDFHIMVGSPAIDSGDSSVPNYPPTDAEGGQRFDDPGTPNSGIGPISYTDRGALEFFRVCSFETCDGVDNDCDGSVDEGFDLGAACTVGVGACQASGTTVCSGDHSQSVCSASPGTPSAELCDAIDNDCDGSVDEGFNVGAACTVGVGACQASGTTVCSGDHSQSVCSASPGAPSTELCGDAIDNDCDGSVDEGFNVGAACTVGVGACQASGTTICSADQTHSECSAVMGTPSAELCGDAIDNDCDGSVDEGFNVGAACTVGVGACQASGTMICSVDQTHSECSAVMGTPSAEMCDAIDNDCDGSVDDGFDVGAPCSAGVGACYASGTKVCTTDGSATECTAVAGTPSLETCDNVDNDCDGSVDDGDPGGGEPCGTSSTPPCSLGLTVCQNGAIACVGSVEPALETCDGQDNDCDGSIDDAAAPRSAKLALSPSVGASHLEWILGDAASYDLVRGSLGVLVGTGGDFTAATTDCLANDAPDAFYDDPAAPPVGDGYWYLVRGVNPCGVGSYDSGAASQIGSRDAEIGASPHACP